MKIFRFLADVLSQHEFDSLSYYHVSRFISTMIQINGTTTSQQPSDRLPAHLLDSSLGQMSLRQFVCNALDFSYEQTPTSKAVL